MNQPVDQNPLANIIEVVRRHLHESKFDTACLDFSRFPVLSNSLKN